MMSADLKAFLKCVPHIACSERLKISSSSINEYHILQVKYDAFVPGIGQIVDMSEHGH